MIYVGTTEHEWSVHSIHTGRRTQRNQEDMKKISNKQIRSKQVASSL